MAVIVFFFLKWPFPEMPPIPRFRFRSTAQNENVESAEIFCFLLTYKKFYYI